MIFGAQAYLQETCKMSYRACLCFPDTSQLHGHMQPFTQELRYCNVGDISAPQTGAASFQSGKDSCEVSSDL